LTKTCALLRSGTTSTALTLTSAPSKLISRAMMLLSSRFTNSFTRSSRCFMICCHPERSEAESKDPVKSAFGFATGWKAWPRGLRPLRCSLDYARNDSCMNRILDLNFGRARIGVAISDELHLLAHPLETISANQQPAARIAEIVREKKVDRIV